MKKEKTLIAIIGLLAGVIIGYVGSNYLNTGATISRNSEPTSADGPVQGMPADHPPTGQGGGGGGGAMEAIERARKDPKNFDAQIQAAGLFKQINRNQEALEFLNAAAKLKPNDYDLLVNLGNTTFDLRQYEAAEGWYAKALKIRPDDVVVRMDLGLTYFLREPRDIDRAIAEYRKGLSVDPGHEKTLQNLVAALIEKGDKAGAGPALAQLEKVNPSNPAVAQFKDMLKE
ncbi:MAG: tetratricopeptide repeat protein [Blastocatellales bacterium]